MAEIPADILIAIKMAAKDEWTGDRDMQDYYIEAETKGYLAIEQTDFGDAAPFKEKIIGWAIENNDQWEDRAAFVAEEVESYAELQDRPDDVPEETFDGLKHKAAADMTIFHRSVMMCMRASSISDMCETRGPRSAQSGKC